MKLNFLMIAPRIVNEVGEWYMLASGMPTISACLKRDGFNLQVLNLNNIAGEPKDIIPEYIKKYNIDVVLMGGLSPHYEIMKGILDVVKSVNPSIKVIVGGGIVTSAPIHSMVAFENADYGVIGEGDIIDSQICAALENGADVSKIAGVVYRNEEGEFVITEGKPALVDINSIPIPDYEGFGLDLIMDMVPNRCSLTHKRTANITMSRSCPFRCTFCFQERGSKYRQKSLDNVFKEIDYLVTRFGVEFLFIQDDLFCSKKDYVAEFCQRIKKYDIKWVAYLRVTDAKEDILQMMKDAGCKRIFFGTESAHNDVLKSMKKMITIDDAERAIDIARKIGIAFQSSLIFGDRAETRETAKTSFEWRKKYPDCDISMAMVIPFPGSEIHRYALEKGIIKDPVEFIKKGCPVVKLSDMSNEDYEWMQEQLLSFQRSLDNYPKELKITNFDMDRAVADISGVCYECGTYNEWEEIQVLKSVGLNCSKCGANHRVYTFPELLERLEINIKKLTKRYGKIAFWGIIPFVYSILLDLESVEDKNVFFVDMSDVRKGVKVGKHRKNKISTVDILKQEDVKCVICVATEHYCINRVLIKKQYHEGVEVIMSITHLLSDNVEEVAESFRC